MNGYNGPPLRWQVWVDWAGAGDWGAANADLSDDVLALRWQAGRHGLPIPEFAPPATLELTLRSRTARPGRTLSPRGPAALPGV